MGIRAEHWNERPIPHHVLGIRVYVYHFDDITVFYQLVVDSRSLMESCGYVERAGSLNSSPEIKTESVVRTQFGHCWISAELRENFNKASYRSGSISTSNSRCNRATA